MFRQQRYHPLIQEICRIPSASQTWITFAKCEEKKRNKWRLMAGKIIGQLLGGFKWHVRLVLADSILQLPDSMKKRPWRCSSGCDSLHSLWQTYKKCQESQCLICQSAINGYVQ